MQVIRSRDLSRGLTLREWRLAPTRPASGTRHVSTPHRAFGLATPRGAGAPPSTRSRPQAGPPPSTSATLAVAASPSHLRPTRGSADDPPPAVLDEPATPPAGPPDRHGAPPDRRNTASTPPTPPPGGAGTAAGVSTRIRGATPNLTPGAQASRRRPAMPHGAARARLQRHDQHRHRRGHAARPHDPLAGCRTGGHRPGPRGKRSRPAATPGTRGTSPAPGLLRAASHAPGRCGGPGRGGRTRACT